MPRPEPRPHAIRRLCHGLVALIMALTLLVPDVAPAALRAGPAADAGDRRLEIDTTALDEDASAAVAGRIRRGVGQAVRLFEEYSGSKLDPGVEIEIRIVPLLGNSVGYRVTLVGLVDGQPAASTPDPFECPACTETELADRVIEEVGLLLPKLRSAPARDPEPEPERAPVAEPEGPQRHGEAGQATTDPEPSVTPASPGLSRVAKAGIATIAVGGVGVGVGLGLVLRSDTQSPSEGKVETVSTKPIGWSLVGAGAAVLVVGVALLVHDRVRSRRTAGRGSKDRRAVFVPQVGPHGAGLGVALRY